MHIKTFSIKGFLILGLLAGLTTFLLASPAFAREPIRTLIMVSEQYRAARDDPDYFLVMIQLAYYDQEFEKVDKQGEQSLPYMNWKLLTQI